MPISAPVVRHGKHRGPARIRGPLRGLAYAIVPLFWAVGVAAAPSAAPRACAATSAPAVEGVVLNRLEVLRAMGGEAWAGGERLRARIALPGVYQRRGGRSVWLVDGHLSPCASALLERIGDAGEDALEPADYHAAALRPLVDRVASGSATPAELADLDLLLTDAFLTLGSHLAQGRVNPATLEAEWLANRRQLDMGAVLEAAVESGDVRAELDALRPQQPGYLRLRAKLAALEAVQTDGGWGSVPDGPTLRPGEEAAAVGAVRRRLRAGGDLSPEQDAGGTLFDPALAAAVARFQVRHGLEVDSAVGARTRAAMNVPVEQRIAQVAVNLERWRWLPDQLGRRHVRVNIADYRVEVWEEGELALEMRAVVGRDYRQTPSFSSTMTYLVLAPFWHVPPGIAMNDKLPELKRNPGYLASQNMTLLTQASNQPVAPASVDFSSLTGSEFNRRYRIRQDPGPLNALGRVKFMFPNRHNVYLHDTPSRELFSRTERAFSSGCVRLERPLDLAVYLLGGDPGWTRERITSVALGTQESTVRLQEPVPVHLLYWTAFVDDEGRVHFRPDIYQRDTRVRSALDEDPPEV